MSTSGKGGDALTRAGHVRAVTHSGKKPQGQGDAGSRLDALLSMPAERTTTEQEKAEADAQEAAQKRSAALQACDYVTRHGCCGKRCAEGHEQHAEDVRLYLMALGLLPDRLTERVPGLGYKTSHRKPQRLREDQ